MSSLGDGERSNYAIQAFDIVLKSEFLQWHEAVAFGAMNKEFLSLYKDIESHLSGWETLLEVLKSLNKTNEYWGNEEYGTFNNLDPRLIGAHPYHTADARGKCIILTEYTAFLVRNLRKHHPLEYITVFSKLPEVFQKRYKDGFTIHTPWDRYAFILNLIALTWARKTLTSRGGSCDWDDTFKGGAYCFEMETTNRENLYYDMEQLCSLVGDEADRTVDIDPNRKCTDKDVDLYLNKIKLPRAARETLGKTLFNKLEILSPFYDFESGELVLPEGLERDGTTTV